MPNIPAIKARYEAATNGVACGFCTIEIDGAGNAVHEPSCILADIPQLVQALEQAQGLAANLAQRLQEAKDRKVLLNGMTQEQKAAIFDIKAIVSDGVRHYEEACARTLKGE